MGLPWEGEGQISIPCLMGGGAERPPFPGPMAGSQEPAIGWSCQNKDESSRGAATRLEAWPHGAPGLGSAPAQVPPSPLIKTKA